MAFKPTPAWRPTLGGATQWLTLRPLTADVRYRVLRLAAVAAATGVVVALWNGIDVPDPAAPATNTGAAIMAPAPEVRLTTTPDAVADAGTAVPGAADGQAALPRPPEPADPERPDRFVRFTVQPGDTLYDISVVYGVSIEEILQYNPALGDGTRIEVGGVVLVPQFDD